MRLIQFGVALLFFNSMAYAQTIEGIIKNMSKKGLEGVHISEVNGERFTTSDEAGYFSLGVEADSGTIKLTHIGFKTLFLSFSTTINEPLEILMEPDYLGLDEVIVTGTFISGQLKNLPSAVSTITDDQIVRRGQMGIASVAEAVPGVYVDASAGEVYSRVYARGISISAEDDLGWYYVGLQEDGLPVTSVQFASFTPDLFHRVEPALSRVEVVRGGSASISSINTPGGLFNYIIKPVTTNFKGKFATNTGFQENGNLFTRNELLVSGPLSGKLGYQLSGVYRFDQGARNTDYDWLNNGGVLRGVLSYSLENGQIALYGKYLNDHVNRWTGVTAENWTSPQAAFDQNFKTTAQLLPRMNALIPDGIGGTYEFDTQNGIHPIELQAGIKITTLLNEKWELKNNFRFSSKTANWQTSLSSAMLGLDSFLPYFASGAGFPVGVVSFSDPKSGLERASINNTGIFGDPPTFDYLTEGMLPFDATLGVAAWYKEDSNEEWMNQFSLNGQIKDHRITGGLFTASSKIETLTRASFAYATYEALPTAMTALVNNGGPDLYLSDFDGFSNYGGLFFEQGNARVQQIHGFVQDQWSISDDLLIDLGIKLQYIRHDGEKDRFEPLSQEGGWDGDEQTAYDNSILIPSGDVDEFDFSYTNASYSFGINYSLNAQTNLFGRISQGYKAPELDYYFNNFSNIPVNQEGPVQNILQLEAGAKYGGDYFSFIPVLYYSRLSNVGFSNFVFDENNGNIFYTPIQFNSTHSYGLELESIFQLTEQFLLRMNATVQKHEALEFTVYDANGTIETDDDQIAEYNGNQLPFNPGVIIDVTPEYRGNRLSAYFNWRFLGERQANISNAVQLPSFSIFHAGVNWEANDQIEIGLHIRNLFSSEGLMNFYGPNFFGASKDDATEDYVSANQDGNFIVVPVQARLMTLRLSYSF